MYLIISISIISKNNTINHHIESATHAQTSVYSWLGIANGTTLNSRSVSSDIKTFTYIKVQQILKLALYECKISLKYVVFSHISLLLKYYFIHVIP